MIVIGVDIFLFKGLKKLQSYTNLTKFSWVNKKVTSAHKTTIILTGDIMLGRSVMTTSLGKNNPHYPFEKVADTLKEADLVFGNLENPVVTNCPPVDSGFKFCTDPAMIEGLIFAGIDIVNLANNHTLNYGRDGFNETKEYLNKNKIDYVGDGNLVIKNIGGTNFGFLGFDFLTEEPKEEDYQLVESSNKKVDVLIVMIHWGVEYVAFPNNMQKSTANNLVNSGADIIVGNHPHWVQSIEYIDGKPIFYSLGNFVFDQDWSEETKKGLAIRLTYEGDNLSEIEKLPIYMKSFAQPEWSEDPKTIF